MTDNVGNPVTTAMVGRPVGSGGSETAEMVGNSVFFGFGAGEFANLGQIPNGISLLFLS